MSTLVQDVATSYVSTNLKTWAVSDRPREKLVLRGRAVLSDAELVAILLRSGSAKETAVDLARRILHTVDADLARLGQLTVAELIAFHGIGEAKAITLIAALELGRRRQHASPTERPQIRTSHDAYAQLALSFQDLQYEACWMLALNRANRVLATIPISNGGMAGTVVDAKLVFGRALEHKASSIILAHNHPSGNIQASQADIDLTKKLVTAGKNLDLPLLDHLIITNNGYLSMADEGIGFWE